MIKRFFLLVFIFVLVCSSVSAVWWDTNWNYKQKITLATSTYLTGNVTADHVIPIFIDSSNTAFWENVNTSGEDVRFVNATETAEYDFYFEKFDYTQKEAVAQVEITDTFSNTSNLELYFYYANATATDGQEYENTFPATYTAYWDFNESSGTTGFDKTTNTFDLTHVNTPTLNSVGKINGDINYSKGSNQYSFNDTLLDGGATAFTFSTWINFGENGWDNTQPDTKRLFYKSNAAGNLIIPTFNTSGDILYFIFTGGNDESITSSKASWSPNIWYNLIFTFDTVSGTRNLYVNGSTVDGATATNPLSNLVAGTTTNFILANDSSEANSSDLNISNTIVMVNTAISDDEAILLYRAGNNDLETIGEGETKIDLNISSINGKLFTTHPTFAFVFDGNVLIDFNIFTKDNKRFTIDFNYSKTTDRGTGNVIVKDLNLTSVYCSDQDWNDIPSVCSFPFDYSNVDDGNYFILGLLKSTIGTTDFNTSDGNFEILTDVNLVVKIPINEETNVIIDTVVSSFIVRINADGILSTFSGLTEDTGFMVEFSSDFIVVEVDTNTPSLFNSRVYSFLFDEVQVDEFLQPYLPPVAASILTTVKVLQFENLKPIPDVRLKVFKDFNTGKTLIHDSITDGKGETSIPFIVADLYEIEVLVGNLIIFTETYIATATTNEHFIFISSTGEVVFPDELTTPTVVFTPAQKHFNTVDVNLGVIVSTNLSNIAGIHYFITNADFNIFDSGLDIPAPPDGNFYSVNINDLQGVSNTNFPFVSTVIVILDDGNSFVFSASYSLKPDSDNVLNILMYDMREEFDCNIDDLSITCDGLMFIAFFVILFVLCAFAAGARGIVGGEGLSLMGLILTMFFVFIAWIPLWIGLVMIFAAMGVIMTRTRFIGA